MNSGITGAAIRRLREARGLTQAELASIIGVSDKAVSKWETAKGLPDIALIEPLSQALGTSVMELMKGESVVNHNRAANMLRTRFYVCPICSNIIHATGEALISCCGSILPPLEAKPADPHHSFIIEKVEDEHFIRMEHPMTKGHYISFLAFITWERMQLIKLYPESNAETRIQLRGRGSLYAYCTEHGLIRHTVSV